MKQLQNLDWSHPGYKEIIQSKGLSVQAQDKYPLRTPIDQRGEQTLNKDAKSTGGIKSFANTNDAVAKWTLNRASQVKVTVTLKKFSGVSKQDEKYKPLHPYQIVKPEKWTAKLKNTISQDF